MPYGLGGNAYVCERSGVSCFLGELLSDDEIALLNVPEVLGRKHDLGEGALEDVCSGSGACANDCVRRKLVTKMFTRRQVEQRFCIETYKDMLAQREGRYVDSGEAMARWIDDGFAEVFAEVYRKKKDGGTMIHHEDLLAETEAVVH
jgi:hypothetical protein